MKSGQGPTAGNKKRKMKYLAVLILTLTLLSFDQVITSTDLNGKWVDVNTETDTLTFETVDKRDYIILGRGKEVHNGHSSTKSCYGLYTYKLLAGDRISLSWIYSSSGDTKNYYFKQTGDVIDIEEFYCLTQTGTKLKFKKLN